VSLDTRGFLAVSCHVSAWQGAKKDRALTDSACDATQADRDRLRVVKRLMDCPELRAVHKAGNALRDEIVPRFTTASPIKGVRILRVSLHPDFSAAWADGLTAYEDAKAAFLSVYAERVREQQYALRGAFKPEDYPEPSEIAKKFGVRLSVQPITSPNQITGLAPDIIEQVTDTYSEMLRAATKDVWSRFIFRLSNFVTALKGAERLHASNWEHLSHLCSVAGDLLPEPDPEFAAVVEEVAAILRTAPKDAVKDNAALRDYAADEAGDRLKRLQDNYKHLF